jgi:aspartate carbamoyltransferase catalytic subunit
MTPALDPALVDRFKGRDILSTRDFTREEILFVLDAARLFADGGGEEARPLRGKVLATLFFEPSTRTRLSFEAAIKRLGGNTIGFADAGVSSAAKGESLHDTVRVVEGYCDAIVIRHPREGAARLAAEATRLPVVNGGDGSNQHPTQTFIDLYTIREAKGKVSGLHIGFLGDLKYGRAAHALLTAAAAMGNRLTLISPVELRLPGSIMEELKEAGAKPVQTSDLDAALRDLDVLYVTRIQQERFHDPLEYERVRNAYRLDRRTLEGAGRRLSILHPLPRVREIDPEVDSMEGALYFRQAHNGVTVRKALLCLLLGVLP